MVDDRVAWLMEQIAEDKRRAQRASRGPWMAEPGRVIGEELGDYDVVVCHLALLKNGEHIAAWDPARVLAECDAKRRTVELHARIWLHPGAEYFNDAHLTSEPMPICRSCVPEKQFRRATSWPCRTLKVLALPYADRPGYREVWGSAGAESLNEAAQDGTLRQSGETA